MRILHAYVQTIEAECLHLSYNGLHLNLTHLDHQHGTTAFDTRTVRRTVQQSASHRDLFHINRPVLPLSDIEDSLGESQEGPSSPEERDREVNMLGIRHHRPRELQMQ